MQVELFTSQKQDFHQSLNTTKILVKRLPISAVFGTA
jgi:hypothetical protein